MSLHEVFMVIIRTYHTFESVCNKIIHVGIVLLCFRRTLTAPLLHLARVAKQCDKTGMTSHNLAIVWAPKILRCKELEVKPVAARLDISIEVAVINFLICYADKLFQPTGNPHPAGNS
jgi:hypothetical protein